jgi:hypothetical protein
MLVAVGTYGMETFLPIILGAGLAIAMAVEWSSRPRSRAWAALRRMKNITIAQVKDGVPARITGTVSALGTTMTSPIGERPCIGFRLEIERVAGRRRPNVMRREECRPFAIADASGKATIEGPVLLGVEWEHDWSELPQQWYGVLEAAGVLTEGLFFRRRFNFRQALLQPGDRVSACGVAYLEPDPTAPAVGLREPALRPHLRGTKRDQIAVGDAGPLNRVTR